MLIFTAALNVSRYRGPNDFGHGAIFNGSNGFKRFRLIR